MLFINGFLVILNLPMIKLMFGASLHGLPLTFPEVKIDR